ncbi:molecular chaperone [Klebsiella pneumoniae]|uniref:fimbrial biogenesis chaperone n=1 Tax=Klebsiella pneumoniae TaxID=573 RepID=UPI00203DBCE2|nr:molecular chaperone [Klebsiella pneumoniae]USB67214.1 molecular chaperone [Klebsiella pneumoniae]HBT4924923.1 molecular chaperone [Klebsiella pneumoniae]
MKYKLQWAFFFLLTTCASVTNASVVMTGTRVIFPSTATEKTIQLKNSGDQPYVVQMQMAGENGKPDDSSPFTLVPPVFRMEPHTGQSVRLIFTGKTLPQDRESVFYLDFTQLPALKKSEQYQNQLIIAVRNRVKVFFRPTSLIGSQTDAYQSLVFSITDGKLNVDNPTGFYIPVRRAEFSLNGKNYNLADSIMLSPLSETQWPLPNKITTLHGARLKFTMVNEYGVDVKREKSF